MKGIGISGILLAAVVIAANTVPAAGTLDRDRVRLLSFGGGPSHPYQDCSRILFEYLADFGIYDATYTESPSALHWESLQNHDVLLVYAIQFDHDKVTPEPVREGILRFLDEGRGLVVVHAGVASFSTWTEYADIVGAYWRWGKSTHDPYRPIMVDIADGHHPITRGLLDFKIIDEFYFNLEPGEGNRLLLTSTHRVQGEQRTESIAWTRTHGDARVFVNVLGHDQEPWKNVSFLKIMRRGIDWAAGRQ